MASRNTRKTWETAFLLSASMSSSYQETFDKARNIMHELGAENVQLGDEAERAAQRQENAFNLMASALAEAGLYEMLGRIKDAYTDIIEVTEEFEYTVSAVKAISDAGAEDIAQLEAKARDLGETTVFTARQSAEAMTFMAQAGWDTVEMLEGMDGVISLAAASGTDLAETSSIVADTLAGFGMSADETTRLADVLAQTASHTNTNVSLMGNTFQNAAAIAGALGFSIEDVSVMLGVMANAGVKGSRAGTSLRNIFNGLAKDATLTADAFGEVDFSMFDDEGKSKRLIDVVRELRGYFSQMTDQEKYLNASNLAGLRGYNALLAVINTTDEQFEELYEDIENAGGAAKRMADTRLDNLKGDVTLLASAFESLKITIGEHFMPAGRELTQWLTEVTTGTNAFVEAHPGIVTGINAIVGALRGALAMFTAISAAIKIKSLISMLAGLFTPGGWLVVGIGAVIGLVAALAVHAAEVRAEIAEMYADQMEAAERLKEYSDTYRENAKAWRESIDAIDTEARNTDFLFKRLENLYSIQDKTLAQKQQILTIVELLNEAVPDLALAYDAEADSLNLTADAIRERARAEVEAEMMAEKNAQLKEKIRQQSELRQKLSDAEALYSKTSTQYKNVLTDYITEYYGNPDDMSAEYYDEVRHIADTAPIVAAAKKANQEAKYAFEDLLAQNKNNEDWINILSRDLAGDTSETEEASSVVPSPIPEEDIPAHREAQQYFKNQEELTSRMAQMSALEDAIETAQAKLTNTIAAREEAAFIRREFDKKYERYDAIKGGAAGTISDEMEQRNIQTSRAYEKAVRDQLNAQADLEAAIQARDENNAAIEALSGAMTDYAGEAAIPEYRGAEPGGAPGSEGYTVNVENTINITGDVDDDTIAQFEEAAEEAAVRALKKTIGTRNRSAYDGGY